MQRRPCIIAVFGLTMALFLYIIIQVDWEVPEYFHAMAMDAGHPVEDTKRVFPHIGWCPT